MSEKEFIIRCPSCCGSGKAPSRAVWQGSSSTAFSIEEPDCPRCNGKKVVKQIVKTEVRYESV